VTASDIIAVIGSLAAAITLIINTYYSAKAKSLAEETKNVATDTNALTRRHKVETEQIKATVEEIKDNVVTDTEP
jgi:hypothetical protein